MTSRAQIALKKIAAGLEKQADGLNWSEKLAIPGVTNRLAKLPGISHLGKAMSRGRSAAEVADTDRRLEMQRKGQEASKQAQARLTAGRYANPANMTNKAARNDIHNDELRARTRITYSGRAVSTDPKNPSRTNSYDLLMSADNANPAEVQKLIPNNVKGRGGYVSADDLKYYKMQAMADRAKANLGWTRYANPANVFGPDAKKNRDAIEHDERTANTIWADDRLAPWNGSKPYLDPEWVKTHPIDL